MFNLSAISLLLDVSWLLVITVERVHANLQIFRASSDLTAQCPILLLRIIVVFGDLQLLLIDFECDHGLILAGRLMRVKTV